MDVFIFSLIQEKTSTLIYMENTNFGKCVCY